MNPHVRRRAERRGAPPSAEDIEAIGALLDAKDAELRDAALLEPRLDAHDRDLAALRRAVRRSEKPAASEAAARSRLVEINARMGEALTEAEMLDLMSKDERLPVHLRLLLARLHRSTLDSLRLWLRLKRDASFDAITAIVAEHEGRNGPA